MEGRKPRKRKKHYTELPSKKLLALNHKDVWEEEETKALSSTNLPVWTMDHVAEKRETQEGHLKFSLAMENLETLSFIIN